MTILLILIVFYYRESLYDRCVVKCLRRYDNRRETPIFLDLSEAVIDSQMIELSTLQHDLVIENPAFEPINP